MKRTTGGHYDRKGEGIIWKQDLQCTSHPFEVVVVVVAGSERVKEETATPVWLYWNLEALAAEARQEVRLMSTSKAWMLTRFPSKESQTFISCMCLPSSIWLWSVLPCSKPPPSSALCWIGAFVKNKTTLYLTNITQFCFQKCCFSQHQGNFNQKLWMLRLCPGW